MKLKKLVIILFIFLLSLTYSFVYAQDNYENNLDIDSESAILIEASTRKNFIFQEC